MLMLITYVTGAAPVFPELVRSEPVHDEPKELEKEEPVDVDEPLRLMYSSSSQARVFSSIVSNLRVLIKLIHVASFVIVGFVHIFAISLAKSVGFD